MIFLRQLWWHKAPSEDMITAGEVFSTELRCGERDQHVRSDGWGVTGGPLLYTPPRRDVHAYDGYFSLTQSLDHRCKLWTNWRPEAEAEQGIYDQLVLSIKFEQRRHLVSDEDVVHLALEHEVVVERLVGTLGVVDGGKEAEQT